MIYREIQIRRILHSRVFVCVLSKDRSECRFDLSFQLGDRCIFTAHNRLGLELSKFADPRFSLVIAECIASGDRLAERRRRGGGLFLAIIECPCSASPRVFDRSFRFPPRVLSGGSLGRIFTPKKLRSARFYWRPRQVYKKREVSRCLDCPAASCSSIERKGQNSALSNIWATARVDRRPRMVVPLISVAIVRGIASITTSEMNRPRSAIKRLAARIFIGNPQRQRPRQGHRQHAQYPHAPGGVKPLA